MALQGNLDAFPLPEVIRLLARSQQTGDPAVGRCERHALHGFHVAETAVDVLNFNQLSILTVRAPRNW